MVDSSTQAATLQTIANTLTIFVNVPLIYSAHANMLPSTLDKWFAFLRLCASAVWCAAAAMDGETDTVVAQAVTCLTSLIVFLLYLLRTITPNVAVSPLPVQNIDLDNIHDINDDRGETTNEMWI